MGTVIVLLCVIALCAAIIVKMRNDKKNGKGGCSGDCSGCAASGGCHK